MVKRPYVLVWTCQDGVESELLRAALEASGVPVRLEGRHAHGILGSLQGAMIKPRLMVPPEALSVARQLISELVGPLEGVVIDPPRQLGPWRHPAEPAPQPAFGAPPSSADTRDGAQGSGRRRHGDDSDAEARRQGISDEPAEGAEHDAIDLNDDDAALAPRKKSAGLVLLLAFMGLTLGFAHLYVGRPTLGKVLLGIAAVGLALRLAGHPYGTWVLVAVWLFDLVGGLIGVARCNASTVPSLK